MDREIHQQEGYCNEDFTLSLPTSAVILRIGEPIEFLR